MAWRWDVPVQLDLLRHHGGNGNSGWGRGADYGFLVPTTRPNPCLSYYRPIVRKEGVHYGPRLGRILAPVFLKTCLDMTDECLGAPLRTVPDPSCRNPGGNKLPGFC